VHTVQIIAFLARSLSRLIFHIKSLLSILHLGRQNKVTLYGVMQFSWDLLNSIACDLLILISDEFFQNNTFLLYCVSLISPGKQFRCQMNARSGLVNADENLQLVFCTLLVMNHLIRKFLSVPIIVL